MVGAKEAIRSATPYDLPHEAVPYGIYFPGGKMKE